MNEITVKALYDKVTKLNNTYCSVQVVFNNRDRFIEISRYDSPESLVDALKQCTDEGLVFHGVVLQLFMDNNSTKILISKDKQGYYISVDTGTCFVQERGTSLPDALHEKYLASSADVFSGVAGQRCLDDLFSLVTVVIRSIKKGDSTLDYLENELSTSEDNYQIEAVLTLEKTEPAPTVEDELHVFRAEFDKCLEDLSQRRKDGYSVKAVSVRYMVMEVSLCELTRYVKEEKYAMHCDLFDGCVTFHGEGKTVQEAAENAGDIYKGIWLTDVKQQLERIYELFSRFAW